MTIYIAGPDGKPLAFATKAEADAYRRTRRNAEPRLLRCLRRHRDEVFLLHNQAHDALEQRRGRSAALVEIEGRLSALNHAMMEDIEAAEREVREEAAPS